MGKKLSELSCWDGSKDIPYCTETREYLVVNSCDINSYRTAVSKRYVTERVKGRPDYYILYVESGKLTVWFGEERREAYDGDLILYLPNEHQHIEKRTEDKTTHYWMHFIGYAVPELLAQCGFTESGIYHVGTSELIAENFMQLMMSKKLRKSDIEVNSDMLRLLAQLSVGYRNSRSAGGDTKVLRAIMQLQWEHRDPKAIPYYAGLCGLSVGHFELLFKNTVGKTPKEYIEGERMIDAVELLENTCMQISEVAEKVGYRDPLYFSRVFRKHMGKSPKQYRKEKLPKEAKE